MAFISFSSPKAGHFLTTTHSGLQQATCRRRLSTRTVNGKRWSLQQPVMLSSGAVPSPLPESNALIFDCDGVIVESEELHRLSYNECWAEAGLGFEWDYALYEKLQNSIGGGKEKMRWYFNTYGWPDGNAADTTDDSITAKRVDLIAHLHKRKTALYQQLIRDGRAQIRPGVLRVMDEAHERGLKTAICSAANADAVRLVLNMLLGEERLGRFDVVLAGDDVKQKKPDPMIYNVARERLGVDVANCVVVEDTEIGLKAALGAQMNVVITYTSYTESQLFQGAAAIYPNLGEEGSSNGNLITIDVLFPHLARTPISP